MCHQPTREPSSPVSHRPIWQWLLSIYQFHVLLLHSLLQNQAAAGVPVRYSKTCFLLPKENLVVLLSSGFTRKFCYVYLHPSCISHFSSTSIQCLKAKYAIWREGGSILTLWPSSYQRPNISTFACFLLKEGTISLNARLLFNCISNVLQFLKPQLLTRHSRSTNWEAMHY